MRNQLYQKLRLLTEAGETADPADIECAIMSDDLLLQWIGCKAAGQSGDCRWADRLATLAVRAIPKDEPDVSLIAVTSIAQLGGAVAREFWMIMSGSPDANARRAAADLIGELRDDEALHVLEVLLRDADSEVLTWAALSAAKLGDRAWPILERVVQQPLEDRAFLNYADALLKIDINQAKPVIDRGLSVQAPDRQIGLRDAVASIEARLRAQSIG